MITWIEDISQASLTVNYGTSGEYVRKKRRSDINSVVQSVQHRLDIEIVVLLSR